MHEQNHCPYANITVSKVLTYLHIYYMIHFNPSTHDITHPENQFHNKKSEILRRLHGYTSAATLTTLHNMLSSVSSPRWQ
jgi:hypothetical protein